MRQLKEVQIKEEGQTQYFTFNPNGLSIEKWKKLGLSEKQALAIHRYESKGGKFKEAEDLKKMYVISEEQYALWEEYISIPQLEESIKITEIIEKTNLQVDLNSASEEELKKIKGVGDFYAKIISERREELGGYVHEDQLLELWKMDSLKWEGIKSQVLIRPELVTKLDINAASKEELKEHPYISWKVANSIVELRNRHGSFERVDDIKQSHLIGDSLYLRLQPYLEVKND